MRVVIIDGSKRDREAAQKALRGLKSRYQWELAGTAEDGEKGCELIRRLRPDIVVTEIKLPGMNGLSMIEKLRGEGIAFGTVLLTGQEDFKWAKKAVDTGVDAYLVKPVKKTELCRALGRAADRLEYERACGDAFSLECIFAGCLSGQLCGSGRLERITRARYGFSLSDAGAVFVVWIGTRYEQQCGMVRNFIDKAARERDISVCVTFMESWQLAVAVVYRTQGCAQELFARERNVFKEYIAPGLAGSIAGDFFCLWSETPRLDGLRTALRNLRKIRDYNLLFDRGEMISPGDVERLETTPLQYPADLEIRMRQAVLAKDLESVKKCYYRLYDRMRREPHSPADLKECLIRFNMAVVGVYKTQSEVESELAVHDSQQRIAEAKSWGGIRTAMEDFLHALKLEEYAQDDEDGYSSLIRKAVRLVRKYYDQGVTLEEIAGRLFVSGEYLSAQFKKETGSGFSETVRRLRIERIKSLLVNTRLKLHQIAELTGYSDPKYMSRVFKEETGLLPNEFRKGSH